MKRFYFLLVMATMFSYCKKDGVNFQSERDNGTPGALAKRPGGGGGGGGTVSIFQWQQCFGTRNYETGKGLAKNNTGYMVVGQQSANNQPTNGYAAFYNRTTGQTNTTIIDGNAAPGVVALDDGSFVAVCRTTDPNVPGVFDDGAGDIMLARFDASGQLVSQTAIGLAGGQTPLTIAKTADGGFAVCGYGSGYVFLKIDQDFHLQWEADLPYGDYKALFGYSIIEVDNAFITCGNSMDVNYNHDLLLVSIDKNTHEATAHHFGTPESEELGFGIAQNSSGEIVASGRKDNIVFAQKFDASLNPIDLKTYTGGTGNSIIPTAGGWLIAGLDNAPSTNALLVRLNSDLSLASSNGIVSLGGGGSDRADQVIEDGDGFAFAGTTDSKSGIVSGNHGNTDMWLVRVKY